MINFAGFIISLVVTIVLIPPLMQFASRLQLIDSPGVRKVHTTAIPRVGGVGMMLGILMPIILWVGLDESVISILVGVGIIFVFGIWDDRTDLDYRIKFAGQILAALVVVVHGDVTIKVLPFFGLDGISPWLYYPLTVVVIVAVTNAINLADGLDGLAAGVVLLSLAGIAMLALMSNANDILLIAMVVAGAVIGFLRFNTYPARIFMGDAGSQFLGFISAVLLILLTQKSNTALNPALPLLLLGIPLFDTIFVMVRRIYYKQSPFSPDKNHIHHQLLALNLDHYEAVIIIYIFQSIFVFAGIGLRYQSDITVAGFWLLANILLALSLVYLGRREWRAHKEGYTSALSRLASSGYEQYLYQVSVYILFACLGLLLLVGPVLVHDVDLEFPLFAGAMGGLLLLRLLFGFRLWYIPLRLLLYVAVAFIVYLVDSQIRELSGAPQVYEYVYFGIVLVAIGIGARYRFDSAFETTPTDYLILILLFGSVFLPQDILGMEGLIPLIVKLILMFYVVEILLTHMKGRWSFMPIAALWAYSCIAAKAVL